MADLHALILSVEFYHSRSSFHRRRDPKVECFRLQKRHYEYIMQEKRSCAGQSQASSIIPLDIEGGCRYIKIIRVVIHLLAEAKGLTEFYMQKEVS